MKRHHFFAISTVAAIGLTVFFVTEWSRASEGFTPEFAAYRDSSEVNAALVLSAGTEVASGRDGAGLDAAFEAAQGRAAAAVQKLEASTPWWRTFGDADRERLIALIRKERDLTKKVGDTVRDLETTELATQSDKIAELRDAVSEFELVHGEVMKAAR